ncbi:diadenylate cyclase CdaA [Halanaerobacter jeridensis]|uniref:Diadenylate cyclase n=1 Tax=Halanaerobacter jeridensis TaxID=706427 RepID=A0A938XUW6_9FIRM|nr:diadenylate cyclase CdaA [Halanaerobacter jeridensis]MBM7557965.1 diadenylate cyclase [Halanaerobacter jeridensis]
MEFDFFLFLDILVTAVVVYSFFTFIKGTRAIQLLKGILVLFVISLISKHFGFQIFNFLLERIQTAVLIAIPVIFQPELRRALEQIGRGKMLKELSGTRKFKAKIDELVKATMKLSADKTGALIVLKRTTGLDEIVDTGIELDAKLSSELLATIFFPKSPLHDGAVILDHGRIEAANCLLPLTQRNISDYRLGTRHRAAIGITEESDAVAVIVSEETGRISLAFDGKMQHGLDEFKLKEELFDKFENLEQS